jgi:hypothetical protein
MSQAINRRLLKLFLFCTIVSVSQAHVVKHSGNNKQYCSHLIASEEATLVESAEKITAAILQKDIGKIFDLLHPKRGIAVETDRVLKMPEVKKELNEKGKYYERLFDSAKYRLTSGNPKFISVKDELASYIQKYGEPSFDIAWITSNCKYVDVYLSWKNVYPDQAFKFSLARHEKQWRLIELIIRQDL